MTRALIDGQKIISHGKGNYVAIDDQAVIEVDSWPYKDGRKLRKDECYYNGSTIVEKTQIMIEIENNERILKLKNDELLNELITYILDSNTFAEFKNKISEITGVNLKNENRRV